jgi:hypothetical protein
MPIEQFKLPSIFLAGPTSRDDTPSWRPGAVNLLREAAFDGTVFVPERSNGLSHVEYLAQVEWEWTHLHAATVILFWVPRRLDVWPALTTNVEFGRYVSVVPDKCVYGRPPESEKNRYLDWLYQKLTGRPPESTLQATVNLSVAKAKSVLLTSP